MTNIRTHNQPEFAKIFSALMTAKDNADGLTGKLIVLMHNSEVTFPNEWLKEYFLLEAKERTSRLNSVLVENYPDYAELLELSQTKVDEGNATKRAQIIDQVDMAAKKVKSMQNVLRSCIVGVCGLRLGNATNARVEKNKIVYEYKNEKGSTLESQPQSSNSIIDMGSKATTKEGWRKASQRAPQTPSTKAATTPAAGGKVTLTALCKAILGELGNTNLDALNETDAAMVRAVERRLIEMSFANEQGVVNGDDVAEYYNGLSDYKNELPTNVKVAA